MLTVPARDFTNVKSLSVNLGFSVGVLCLLSLKEVRRESSRKSISGRCPQVNWLDSGDDGVSEGISIGMSRLLGGDGVRGGSLCGRRLKDLLSLVDMLFE